MTQELMLAEIRSRYPSANIIGSSDGTRWKVYFSLTVLARGRTSEEAVRNAHESIFSKMERNAR